MPRVELSAGAIDYEDSGGEGPVILFGHGLMMDGSQWRNVVARLRGDFRCVLPTLPLGAHRDPMRADADLSMRGVVAILEEFIAALDLRELTLAMNDWGGPLLLPGGPQDARIARLAICSCEAFDNVPPRGPARALPYVAMVPGGLDLALLPFRFDRLRRLPMTYGLLSRRAVPREVLDRWFAPIRRREIRRDLRKYIRSAREGRRELLGADRALRAFERPTLIVWASEDRMMPLEHAHRLAALMPDSRLVEIADSYTLLPEDQPEQLARHMRELMSR
jgi:pimeloyl-ACP methyl ester carboxylesterase